MVLVRIACCVIDMSVHPKLMHPGLTYGVVYFLPPYIVSLVALGISYSTWPLRWFSLFRPSPSRYGSN
jgi:hypothetical protein